MLRLSRSIARRAQHTAQPHSASVASGAGVVSTSALAHAVCAATLPAPSASAPRALPSPCSAVRRISTAAPVRSSATSSAPLAAGSFDPLADDNDGDSGTAADPIAALVREAEQEDATANPEQAMLQQELEEEQEILEELADGGEETTGANDTNAAITNASATASASAPTPTSAASAPVPYTPAPALPSDPVLSPLLLTLTSLSAEASRQCTIQFRREQFQRDPIFPAMRDQAHQAFEALETELAARETQLGPNVTLSPVLGEWRTWIVLFVAAKHFLLHARMLALWRRIGFPTMLVRKKDEHDAAFRADYAATVLAASSASSAAAAGTSIATSPTPTPTPESYRAPKVLLNMYLECIVKAEGAAAAHQALLELAAPAWDPYRSRKGISSNTWAIVLKAYADALPSSTVHRGSHLKFIESLYASVPTKDDFLSGMMLDIYLEWGEKDQAQTFMRSLMRQASAAAAANTSSSGKNKNTTTTAGQQPHAFVLGPSTIAAMLKDVRMRLETTMRHAFSVDKRGIIKIHSSASASNSSSGGGGGHGPARDAIKLHPSIKPLIHEMELLWKQATSTPGCMQRAHLNTTLAILNRVRDVSRMMQFIGQALKLEQRDIVRPKATKPNATPRPTRPTGAPVYVTPSNYIMLLQTMLQSGDPETYIPAAASAYATAQARSVLSQDQDRPGKAFLLIDHRLHSMYFQFLSATGQVALPTILKVWTKKVHAAKFPHNGPAHALSFESFQQVLGQLAAVGGAADHAQEIVRDFETRGFAWRIAMVDEWIGCFERQGAWEGAEKVWASLPSRGLAPAPSTYARLMRVYMCSKHSGQIAKIAGLYAELLSKGLQLSANDFNGLIQVARDCRLAGEVSEWARRAREANLWPKLNQHSRVMTANISRWSTTADRDWSEVARDLKHAPNAHKQTRGAKGAESVTAAVPSWLRSSPASALSSAAVRPKVATTTMNLTEIAAGFRDGASPSLPQQPQHHSVAPSSSSGGAPSPSQSVSSPSLNFRRSPFRFSGAGSAPRIDQDWLSRQPGGVMHPRHQVLLKLESLRHAILQSESGSLATLKQAAQAQSPLRMEVVALLNEYFTEIAPPSATQPQDPSPPIELWEVEHLFSRAHQAEAYALTERIFGLFRSQQSKALAALGIDGAAAVPESFEWKLSAVYTSLLLYCTVYASSDGWSKALALLRELEADHRRGLCEVGPSSYSVVTSALIDRSVPALMPDGSIDAYATNDYVRRVLGFYDSIPLPDRAHSSVASPMIPFLMEHELTERHVRLTGEVEASAADQLSLPVLIGGHAAAGHELSLEDGSGVASSASAIGGAPGSTAESDPQLIEEPDEQMITIYLKSIHLELQYVLDTSAATSRDDCARLTKRAEEVWSRCKQVGSAAITPRVVTAMMKLYDLVRDIPRIKSILKEALLLERAHGAEAVKAGEVPPVYVNAQCFSQLFRSFSARDLVASEHIAAASHAFDLMLRRGQESQIASEGAAAAPGAAGAATAASSTPAPAPSPAALARAEALKVDGVSLKSYLRFLRASGQGSKLLAMYAGMSRNARLQSPFAFVAVLNVLVAKRDLAGIVRAVQEHDALGLPWDVLSFTSLLGLHRLTEDVAGAEAVWAQMESLGFPPDEGIYFVMIQIVMGASAARMARVDELYRAMKKQGLTFRVGEFGYLIASALEKGLPAEAIRWGERCNQAGLASQMDGMTSELLQRLLSKHVRSNAVSHLKTTTGIAAGALGTGAKPESKAAR